VGARAVREAEGVGCDLSGLPLAVLKRFSPAIDKDVFEHLSLEGSVAARDHLGGTAPRQVRAADARARARRAKPRTRPSPPRAIESACTRSCWSSGAARPASSTCATTRSTAATWPSRW
jgi:hypothetical protein